MPRQSDAEYRRQRAANTPADQWHRTSETWFDGTVDSVDRRLVVCSNLLQLSRDAVATEGLGGSTRRHLAAISDLTASQGALMGLRRDLLTAGADRDEVYKIASPYCPQCGEHVNDMPPHHHALGDDEDEEWIKPTGTPFGHVGPPSHRSAAELPPHHVHETDPSKFNQVHDGWAEPNPLASFDRQLSRPPARPAYGSRTAANPHEPGSPLWHEFEEHVRNSQERPHDPAASAAEALGEARLSHRDRRYVALESAKFMAANPGVPADELAIRARHHAELQTSTFSVPRSRAVTAAFVEKVVESHRDTPRPRVAAISPTSVPVGPDELMFI